MKKELAKTYSPKDFEDRLYHEWEEKKYFHAEIDPKKKPYTIVIPPPNITGQLHMGHALDNTLQDILIRYKRMQGYSALWHRPRFNRYRGKDSKRYEGRGSYQGRCRQRRLPRACVGMEKGLRRTYRSAVKEARLVLRLGQRAFHS